MQQFISEIVYWHWFIFAVILLVLELLVSGFFFLWLGAAAASIGVALFLNPELGWKEQGLLFALLSIGYLFLFHLLRHKRNGSKTDSTLNKRGHQYIGRILNLKEGLVNGRGRVPIDDGVWQVRTEDESDIDSGSEIEVINVVRTTLIIRKTVTVEAEQKESE